MADTGAPGRAIRRRSAGTLLVLAVAAVVAGWLATPRPLHAQAPDPVPVAEAYAAARNAHDLAAVLALFAPEAVVRERRGEIPPASVEQRLAVLYSPIDQAASRRPARPVDAPSVLPRGLRGTAEPTDATWPLALGGLALLAAVAGARRGRRVTILVAALLVGAAASPGLAQASDPVPPCPWCRRSARRSPPRIRRRC